MHEAMNIKIIYTVHINSVVVNGLCFPILLFRYHKVTALKNK